MVFGPGATGYVILRRSETPRKNPARARAKYRIAAFPATCVVASQGRTRHGNERHAWSTACGGSRGAALSADPRSRQTGRALRRALPDHRYHSLQLHQLGPAQGIHPHPVQGALAESPCPRRMDRHRGPGTGRVLRAAAAHAADRRQLVHGHRRCCLSEHLFHRQRAAEAHDHPFRRPHLQDGLQPHARVPQGNQGRGDPGHAAHPAGRSLALRRGRGSGQGRDQRLPRKAGFNYLPVALPTRIR